MSYDDKINELKIKLPEAKAPVGNYVATKVLGKMLFISKIHFYKNPNFYKKKTNIFMSIANVYPGPLRSVKQPGKAKTAQFLQK